MHPFGSRIDRIRRAQPPAVGADVGTLGIYHQAFGQREGDLLAVLLADERHLLELPYILAGPVYLAVFPVNHPLVRIVPCTAVDDASVIGYAAGHHAPPVRPRFVAVILLRKGQDFRLAVRPLDRHVVSAIVSSLHRIVAIHPLLVTYPYRSVGSGRLHVRLSYPVGISFLQQIIVPRQGGNQVPVRIVFGEEERTVVRNAGRNGRLVQAALELAHLVPLLRFEVDDDDVVIIRIIVIQRLVRPAGIPAVGRYDRSVVELVEQAVVRHLAVARELVHADDDGSLPGRNGHLRHALGTAVVGIRRQGERTFALVADLQPRSRRGDLVPRIGLDRDDLRPPFAEEGACHLAEFDIMRLRGLCRTSHEKQTGQARGRQHAETSL